MDLKETVFEEEQNDFVVKYFAITKVEGNYMYILYTSEYLALTDDML